jgi:hypothetical protein
MLINVLQELVVYHMLDDSLLDFSEFIGSEKDYIELDFDL